MIWGQRLFGLDVLKVYLNVMKIIIGLDFLKDIWKGFIYQIYMGEHLFFEVKNRVLCM